MFKSILAIVVLLSFLTPMTSAEYPVVIVLNGKLNDQPFAMNTAAKDPSGSYDFNVSRLSYYISEVAIIHDGGKRTLCEGYYFLVHASETNVLELGIRDIEIVEGVEFSVGVDKQTNHQDPSAYPAAHPLALQNPSMHWGWAAGYRFCTFEGYAGPSEPTEKFELHSVGDALYHQVSIDLEGQYGDATIRIPIVANYANLLTNIAAQWGGVLSHGDVGEPVVMMNNFRDLVFTPQIVASVEEVQSMTVSLTPNPATSTVTITHPDLVNIGRVVFRDITGKTVLNVEAIGASTDVSIDMLSAGTYFVAVEGEAVASTTLLQIVR